MIGPVDHVDRQCATLLECGDGTAPLFAEEAPPRIVLRKDEALLDLPPRKSVELDTENAVLETNEVNNLEIAPITVAPAQAELLVTAVTVTPTPAVQRSVTKIDVTVQNAGNLAAGAFTVELSPGGFLPALRTQVDGLAAGTSTVVCCTKCWPRLPPTSIS